MSKSDESGTHVYTINLSKAWLTPRYRRTDRVINMIKEFTKRHMKNENVKIDQELNEELWRRGKTNPPRKIRVKMTTEDNSILVSSYQDILKDSKTEKKVSDEEITQEN